MLDQEDVAYERRKMMQGMRDRLRLAIKFVRAAQHRGDRFMVQLNLDAVTMLRRELNVARTWTLVSA